MSRVRACVHVLCVCTRVCGFGPHSSTRCCAVRPVALLPVRSSELNLLLTDGPEASTTPLPRPILLPAPMKLAFVLFFEISRTSEMGQGLSFSLGLISLPHHVPQARPRRHKGQHFLLLCNRPAVCVGRAFSVRPSVGGQLGGAHLVAAVSGAAVDVGAWVRLPGAEPQPSRAFPAVGLPGRVVLLVPLF